MISTPHARVNPFPDFRMSLDFLRQSRQLTPAAFTSASTMLPNGLEQLLSENSLKVPDILDQHKLQSKKQR